MISASTETWYGDSLDGNTPSGFLTTEVWSTSEVPGEQHSAKLRGTGEQFIEAYKIRGNVFKMEQGYTYTLRFRVCSASLSGRMQQKIYSAFYEYPVNQLQPERGDAQLLATSKDTEARIQHHLDTAKNYTWRLFIHEITAGETYENVRIRLGTALDSDADSIFIDDVEISIYGDDLDRWPSILILPSYPSPPGVIIIPMSILAALM
ncbi:hypothetical protein CYMTET_14084 [Cymbomonas tetramitiformis]|uniref:Uncharacterized protein n=1 Tax=Cymbomonas tetramitiformis TaxID=36881 RepID=A0AAE0GH50_9CHLO|nr:hypothetical protein CYMTET_14084 [Cymbomonas tetramitiformis]